MMQNKARLLAAISRNIIQKRTFESGSVISGPPTVHVSGAEKAVTGLVMFCCWAATPLWILSHLKEYKGRD